MGLRPTLLAIAIAAAMWAGVARAEEPGRADEPARVEEPIPDRSILFSADEVTHDEKTGTVTARGNVEFSQGDRLLLADNVTYNQKEDVLSAHGNVTLLEPTGEVIFAQSVELTGDLKDGILEDIRILLSDTSRIAATGARRSAGTETEMRNAVYSPCRTCADRPDAAPLWQVKAKKVVHDQIAHEIEYSDAWLEIAGVPVAYTPYFSHPDPSVKRKSGFLVPSVGGSSRFGGFISLPYFLNLAPNRDLTITPTFTLEENGILAAEYRDREPTGKFETDGSLTEDSNNRFRGHIRGTARFDVNENWRWGADVFRATDDTYLRRYKIDSSDTLTSNAYAERFEGRNYFSVNAYSFQNLRADPNREESPNILPMVDYNYVSEAGPYGARANVDVNAVSLMRDDGRSTRRLSIGGGVRVPYVDRLGNVYAATASVRGDGYHVDDLVRPSHPSPKFDGFSGRIWPQLALDWRYPWSRQDGGFGQIIEPIGSIIVSPNGGNPEKIPNEDSLDFEFDETNLFSATRFPGLDRVDGGTRINYGLRWGMFSEGGNASVFLGQSYRFHDDAIYQDGSGLEGHISDLVGAVQLTAGEYLDLRYKTRIDKDNFAPRRNEVNLAAGPQALRVNTSYVFFDSIVGSDFPDREEISGSLSSQLSRYWRTQFSARNDLGDNGGLRSVALNITYECECFTLSMSVGRSFYADRDIDPEDYILLRLTFKTLGEVKAGL